MTRQNNIRIHDQFGDSPLAREFVVSACDGKVAFETPQMAASVAKRRRQPGTHYRCKSCGKYHIGHPTSTGRRK